METAQQYDTKITSAKTILLDIEGTTTSKSFVKDVLFPYASENVASFLTTNWDVEDVKLAVNSLKELAKKEKSESVEGCIEIIEEDENNREVVINSVVENVKWQMSLDRKTGPLKTLQGLIWEKGYKDGTIKGHIYDDVPEAFTNWTASGHRLYIYSSGSVAAQKLLFGNTEKGDLLDKITGHFDTSVGGKQEVESYKNISKEIGCNQILFLTDIVNEAKAALEAGMAAVLVQRDSDTTFTDEEKAKHTIIKSFADLPLSNVSGKRKSIDKDEDELHPAKLAKIDEKSEDASVVDTVQKSNEAVIDSAMETEEENTEKPVENEIPSSDVETKTETEKEKSENVTQESETDKTQETEKLQETEKPKDTDKTKDTGKAKETNEVEPMEVDSSKSNLESKEVVCEKASEQVDVKEQCDSTKDDLKETVDLEKTKNIPTDSLGGKLEKLTEDKSATEVDSTKSEVTVEGKVGEENEAETKIAENVTLEKDSVKIDETASVSGSTEVEVDVSSSDNKVVDQIDHALKESNGVETNGTNGEKTEVVEENGGVVESSTNGTDSDKENDKEVDAKGDNVTNGSTNGTTDAIVPDVKVKKLPADSSPISAIPVEETA